jgi:hypothetical protein
VDTLRVALWIPVRPAKEPAQTFTACSASPSALIFGAGGGCHVTSACRLWGPLRGARRKPITILAIDTEETVEQAKGRSLGEGMRSGLDQQGWW